MKSKSGFTLFEIVITLLVMAIIVSSMVPVFWFKTFRYDRSIKELQELINIKTVIENITHDYVNRCFEEPNFDLFKLHEQIGRTGSFVNNIGSPPTYYPYGYNGKNKNYIEYFVKYNEFVKEVKNDDENKTHMIQDDSTDGKMLLVTIQPELFSSLSLTVLFTKNKDTN
jgi:prepilin-type N-terminal cleavage/methylation domain-containing protein